MHSNAILHRDMKCANVFISDGVYKLGDLNVSKVNEHQSKLVRTQTGTPYYASPEVWRDEPYGSKSDIWSFGCILYEMCCMKPPFQGDDLSILYRNVQRGLYEPISSNYSNELGQLIRSCLKQNSRDRPSADQLLSPKGSIIQKCHYYQIEVDYQPARENKSQLLSTIRLPKDMKDLKKSLPIANY